MLIRTGRELITASEDVAAKPIRPARSARRTRDLVVYIPKSQLAALEDKAGSNARASAAVRLLVRRAIRGTVELTPEDLASQMGQSFGNTERRHIYMSPGQFDQFASLTGATPGKPRAMKAGIRALIHKYLEGQLKITTAELDLEVRRANRRTRSR